MELLERVRGLRKQLRKLSQTAGMVEAGYDEDDREEEGAASPEVSSPMSVKSAMASYMEWLCVYYSVSQI